MGLIVVSTPQGPVRMVVQTGASVSDLALKVDKVEGMGLSSNDFTDAERMKLADLEEYDDADIWEAINDGNAKKILSKPITIPTFEGMDGHILAYDEINGEFYLKADDEGGGGLKSIGVGFLELGNLSLGLTISAYGYPS